MRNLSPGSMYQSNSPSPPPSPQLRPFSEFGGDTATWLEHVEQYREYSQVKEQIEQLKRNLSIKDFSRTQGKLSAAASFLTPITMSPCTTSKSLDSHLISDTSSEYMLGRETGIVKNNHLEVIEIALAPAGNYLTPKDYSPVSSAVPIGAPIPNTQPQHEDFHKLEEHSVRLIVNQEEQTQDLLKKEPKKVEERLKEALLKEEKINYVFQKEENIMTDCHQKAYLKEPLPPRAHDCSFCPKIYNSKTQLLDHLRSKHKNPDFCNICGKYFTSHNYLRQHIIGVHSAAQPGLPCQKCGKCLKTQFSLVRHERKCTRTTPQLLDNTGPRRARSWLCTVCRVSFNTKHSYTTHCREKHPKTKHKKKVELLRCNLCAVKVVTVGELNQHITKRHDGEKTWPCSQCDKTFPAHKNLGEHRRRVHCGNKFGCQSGEGKKGCGKTFTRKDGLKKHLTEYCGNPQKWENGKWEELSRWQKIWRARLELEGKITERDKNSPLKNNLAL